MNIIKDARANPKKYSTLLGSVFLMISLGAIGSLANIAPYLISYLREERNQKHLRYSKSIYIHTTQIVSLSLASIVGGFLNRRNVSLKILAAIGSLIICIGVFLSYFTVNVSYFLLNLTYGAIFGIGYGFTYIETILMNMRWFPKNKGVATSFALCGFGIGSFIFPQIQTLYINPKNYSPDKPYSDKFPNEKYFSQPDLLVKVPFVFVIMGLVTVGFSAIGLLLIFEKKFNEMPNSSESEILNINDSDSPVEFKRTVEEIDDGKPSLTVKQILKTKEVYMLSVLYEGFFIAPVLFATNFKNYGQRFIEDDKFLAFISSATGFVNIFSRFLWGVVIDKASFKTSHMIINSLTMVIILTVSINELMKSKVVYFIWVIGVYIVESGMLLLLPTGYSKCYGERNLVFVFAIVQCLAIPGNVLQSLITPLIDVVGYQWFFIIICIFPSIAWVVCFCFNVKNEDGTDI